MRGGARGGARFFEMGPNELAQVQARSGYKGGDRGGAGGGAEGGAGGEGDEGGHRLLHFVRFDAPPRCAVCRSVDPTWGLLSLTFPGSTAWRIDCGDGGDGDGDGGTLDGPNGDMKALCRGRDVAGRLSTGEPSFARWDGQGWAW